MYRVANVFIDLPINDAVIAAALDRLEISLDCSDCKRRRRTIIFQQGEHHGRCTPSGHKFRGKLLNIQQRNEGSRFQIRNEIEYRYEPFIDAKYPNDPHYYGPSEGVPTWARVHFTLTCPGCQAVTARSSQSNLVRPYNEVCKCGYNLYTDEVSPVLSWRAVVNT